MRVGSLFAGIGGFDLGFHRAGFDVRWAVEIDEHARAVYASHFPSTTLHEDVREVGRHNLEPVDVVCGGFPCTDLSVAGRRAGLAGEESGLWWQFHRILAELAPRWCVIENVPGLLSSVCPDPDSGELVPGGACPGGCMRAHGGAMGTVIGALAELGYGWAYRVLDAQWAGVAQRRKRVFIVGCLGAGASAAEVLLEPEGVPGSPPPRPATGPEVASTLGGGSGERGWADDFDRGGASSCVNALTSHEGGVDDNDAQAGRLIAVPDVSPTLLARGFDSSEDGTERHALIVTDRGADAGRETRGGEGTADE